MSNEEYDLEQGFDGGWRPSSTPIAQLLETSPGALVAVCGLPKSGTTWLQTLVADSLGFALSHPNDDRPAVAPRVIKLHDPFHQVCRRKDVRYRVYILRDIRDCIVSFYHYAKTDFYRSQYTIKDYGTLEEFYYDYFLREVVTGRDWCNHPRPFVEAGVPLVKYEYLWDDSTRELEQVFMAWELDVDANRVRASVEKNLIKKMKKTGLTIPGLPPLAPDFFRKGGYGGYVDSLPTSVLEDVERRFGRFLRHWGYDSDMEGRSGDG